MAIKNDPGERLQHILAIQDKKVPISYVLDDLWPKLGLLGNGADVRIAEFMLFETVLKESKKLDMLNLQQLKDLFMADEDSLIGEKDGKGSQHEEQPAILVENRSDDSLN